MPIWKNFPYVLVVLSGFTGLVYQVTWQKYLTFHLGSHAFATTTILAVFFLSLSLGYYFIGNHSYRWMKNQLLLYGVIEGLIGVYCLLSPELFHTLQAHFPAHFADRWIEMLMGFLFTLLFIGFPTFLMGGTIPVLTQALVSAFEESHRIHARIYGLNTFGAFAGTLLAGFIFTDIWGLPLTLIYTSFVNVLIAVVTYFYFKWQPHAFAGIEPVKEKLAKNQDRNQWRLRIAMYVISFLSGFYVFSLESIIIRMAGISLSATTYAFAMIVAAFILAIAVGGYWVSWVKKAMGLKSFYFVQLALVTASALLYLTIAFWPEFFAWIGHLIYASVSSFWVYWIVVTVLMIIFLLIPVGLMGMNLPLLFNFLKARDSALSTTVGRVYAVNSVGSAMGAIVGGYLLFYLWDGPTIFKFDIILMSVALALIGLLVFKKARSRRWVVTVSLFLALATWFLPKWPMQNFTPGLYGGNLNRQIPFRQQVSSYRQNNPIVFSQYDPDALVSVTGRDDKKVLYINGNSNTGPSDVSVRALNALIPLTLVPEAKNAFVIGLGSGLSTGLLAHESKIKKIEVAEIAQGVIDALPQFKYENQKLFDHQSKVTFVQADAYRVLRSSPRQYSIIICEPAHPWVSGVENLYAQEFLEVVRDHLTPDGIFTQWLPLFSTESKTVLTILRTFHSVFPWVSVFSPAEGVLALVGGRQEPQISDLSMNALSISQKEILDRVSLSHASNILGLQFLSPSGLKRLLEHVEGLHTLEFPTMGKAYFYNRFIGGSVSSRQLLTGYVFRPRDHQDVEEQFLYEKFWNKKPPLTFYQAFFKKDRKISISAPIEDRLRFEYQNHYPQNQESQLAAKPFKAMKYMVSELPDKKELTKSKYSDSELSGLFDTFKMLFAAQLPVKWLSIVHLLPEKCESTICALIKSQTLRAMGAKTELDDLLKTQTGKALVDKVDQLYAQFLQRKLSSNQPVF